MRWRESVNEWFRGNDPVFGAMLVAKQAAGDITPGDALRCGLMPAGWTLAGTGHGGPLTNSVRMSDLMPDRIRRARASIESWDFENEVRAICSGKSPDQIRASAERVRAWQTRI